MDFISTSIKMLEKKSKKDITILEKLCLDHLYIIRKNEEYIETINNVVSDVLMNTVKENKNGTLSVNLNKYQCKVISNIYALFNELSYPNISIFDKEFYLYKGVSNISNINIITFPIPFSCCVDFKNAWLWCVSENSFIIEIKISGNFPLIFTGNINEGNEVILPRCKILLVKKSIRDNKKVYSYIIAK